MKNLDGKHNQIKKFLNGGAFFYNLSPKTKTVGI